MRDNVTLLAGAEQVDAAPWLPFDPRAVDFLAELSAEVLRGPGHPAAGGLRRLRLLVPPGPPGRPWPRATPPRCPGWAEGWPSIWPPPMCPPCLPTPWPSACWRGTPTWCGLSSRRVGGGGPPCWAALRRVLERPEHAAVRARTSLITYGRDDAVTADYCARCDARIVWGGDATVAAVRAMPMTPPRRGAVLPRPLVAGGVQPAGLLRPHAGGAGGAGPPVL